MNVNSFVSWQDCHEKGRLFARGVLDKNPEEEFVSMVGGELPRLMKLNREEAMQHLDALFVSFSGEWYDTAEEAAEARNRLYRCFTRMLSYFYDEGYIWEGTGTSWSIDSELSPDGQISGRIDLTVRDRDGGRVFITFELFRENRYSPKARKPENKAYAHPFNCFAAKAVNRQGTYSVWYLKGRSDVKGELPDFEAREGDNIVATTFGGKAEIIAEGIKYAAREPERDCDMCRYRPVCKGYDSTIDSIPVITEPVHRPDKGQKRPERQLTEEQQAVVDFRDGALCVCAVPGAGKTHVLVQRMLKLIGTGVKPCNILFLAFSRKAVEEIRERVARELGIDPNDPLKMPCIMTINGFAYDMARNNEELLGRKVVLASASVRKDLIKQVLVSEPRISNASYMNIKGRFGLVNKVDAYFEVIERCGKQEFEEAYAMKCDSSGICRLYEAYKDRFRKSGYCSYDEQITLATELFTEYPDVVRKYSSIYRYIMVDEFQDINPPQMELIRLLAAHGNIVAVGDDDQSIYAFRGADSSFMIDFPSQFEGAQVMYLSKNFRSNNGIVQLADGVIRKNQNRLGKKISGARQEAAKPVILNAQTDETILKYLEDMRKGYGGRNVAVIARTNKELLAVRSFLGTYGIACTSPKDYLIQDRVFLMLYDLLEIYFRGPHEAATSFSRLYGRCVGFDDDDDMHAVDDEQFYDVLLRKGTVTSLENSTEAAVNFKASTKAVADFGRMLFQTYRIFDYGADAADAVSQFYGLWFPKAGGNFHKAVAELLVRIDEEAIRTVEELYVVMTNLVEYEDTTRLDYDYGPDAVTLITAHDSKGKEWDGVLVYNADTFLSDGDEESRRVLYVAMTRARHTLVMSSSGTITNSRLYEELDIGAATIIS